MILIVDSGSTKADWVILDGDQVTLSFTSEGLNPFSNPNSLTIIQETVAEKLSDYNIHAVYFYGAGIMGLKEKQDFSSAYHRLSATNIEINDDLLGAARACCGATSGVVCILGTGSNIGYYNGSEIKEKVASGGYILGAEGSGMALGREVLKMYIRKQLSLESAQLLESIYEIDMTNIFEKVYGNPIINRYIASYARLIPKLQSSERNQITHKVFKEFLEERILKLNASKNNPINFVGSIAHSFAQELEDMLKSNNLLFGKIVQKPIHNLVKYHIGQN